MPRMYINNPGPRAQAQVFISLASMYVPTSAARHEIFLCPTYIRMSQKSEVICHDIHTYVY